MDLQTIELKKYPVSIGSQDNVAIRQMPNGAKYLEQLLYDDDHIDYSGLIDGGLPLLYDHNQSEGKGRVEGIFLDPVEKKLRGYADFAPSAEITQKDVDSGHLRSLSIGYSYSREDSNMIWSKNESGQLVGTPRKWTPREASLVWVPEDVTAGFYKSLSEEILHTESIETMEQENTEKLPETELVSEEVIEEVKLEPVEIVVEETIETIIEEPITENKSKTELINTETITEQYSVENKKSTSIIEKENIQMENSQTPITLSPNLFGKHLDKYSIGKFAFEMIENGQATGLEAEVSKEMQVKGFSGKSIPTEYFTKSLNFTDVNSGKEANVPSFGGYIDALIAASALGKLGMAELGLVNETTLPRLDSISAPATHGEKAGAVAEGTAATSEVRFNPTEVMGLWTASFRALKFAPSGFDAMITKAITKQTLAKMDVIAFTNFLTEITNTQTTVCADFKHVDAAACTLELLSKVGDYVSTSDCKFAAAVSVYNQLKQVALAGAGVLPYPVFQNGQLQGVQAIEAPNMPLVTAFTPLLVGDWSNAAYSTFGQAPLELSFDRVVLGTSAMVQIIGLSYFDAHILAPKAFAKWVTAN